MFRPAVVENLLYRKNVGGSYYDGEIVGTDLRVSAPGVAEPKELRYLYRRPYRGWLVNEANLPLGVFHVANRDI